MKNTKRIFSILITLIMLLTIFTGCTEDTATVSNDSTTAAEVNVSDGGSPEIALEETNAIPKYIFLFIGDGMSYPQIQTASYYVGAVNSDGGVEPGGLAFTDFPYTGSAQTYDSTSFAPDSSSTATSIATGFKTYSGTLNMDTTHTIAYETISEKLKKQLDYKIGVVTTVNINHATPAAFYAHQKSRDNYYEIGLELIESNFDFFAGGEFLSPGGSGSKPHLHELIEQAGYKMLTTYADFEKLTPADGKAVLVSENVDSSSAVNYSIDMQENEWSLSKYVEKGIEMLANDKGFFMMVEGGKIDWAGHANDAAANINEVLSFSDAIEVAKKFYEEHPEDTLIVVTGDHETGGLTLGFAGTGYDTFFTNISRQSTTYEAFSHKNVPEYKKNKTSFEDVLVDVKNLFGLVTKDTRDDASSKTLLLSAYELGLLENAYNRTMGNKVEGQTAAEESLIYGSYDPLTVTITHLLNNKSGIAWTSFSHTGLPVPVFAMGKGAELFDGYYDNTDIFKKMAEITGVK